MKLLRFILIAGCFLGFLYQTLSFLFYYWTYPVVMDIQTTAPEKFPIPGITFCNGNAIKPNQFCKMGARCWPSFMFSTVNLCSKWADLCEMMENKMPMDFKAVAYVELLVRKDFSPAELQNFKKPIHDFFKCKIVSTDGERNCSTEDALIGSYYSDSGFFGICYTIYSQWSRPNKNIQEMSRSDRIEIEFHVDLVDRKSKAPADTPVLPKFNYPAFPTATQLVLHNNFVSVSPHRNGVDLLGGKRYQIHVKQEKKHLLPAPYQTNCTDYMAAWERRGGTGPLNPMMMVEECKYNLSLQELGCVPISVDFPHNDSVCKICQNCLNMSHIENHCEKLLENYNQPCYFISYKMKLEEKTVLIEKTLVNDATNFTENFVIPSKGYECTKSAILTRRCQTIHVDILFSDFVIATTTYKPKLESSELLSIIGSYMGIYLGISMFSVSELLDFGVRMAEKFGKKQNKKKIQRQKIKMFVARQTIPKQLSGGFHRRTQVYNS